jgi:hypothetical protein
MGRRNLTEPSSGRKAGISLLFPALALAAVFFLAASSLPAAAEPNLTSLESRLGQLKAELEGEAAAATDQKIVTAQAIRFGALAWSAAAEALSPEAAPWEAEERRRWLEEKWADPKVPWPDREVLALRLYFEALTTVAAGFVAVREDQKWAFEELLGIIRLDPDPGRSHDVKFNREGEAKVFWSNRLTAVMSILVRLRTKEDDPALAGITEGLSRKAAQIAGRRDVHYQGRMELLFLNNAQGLARMNFLLAQLPQSPIIGEARSLEETWQEHTAPAEVPVSDQISLTWLTAAQLSFPLAYWLGSPP